MEHAEPEETGQEGLQGERTCSSEGSGEEGGRKDLGWSEERQRQRRGHCLLQKWQCMSAVRRSSVPRTD